MHRGGISSITVHTIEPMRSCTSQFRRKDVRGRSYLVDEGFVICHGSFFLARIPTKRKSFLLQLQVSFELLFTPCHTDKPVHTMNMLLNDFVHRCLKPAYPC